MKTTTHSQPSWAGLGVERAPQQQWAEQHPRAHTDKHMRKSQRRGGGRVWGVSTPPIAAAALTAVAVLCWPSPTSRYRGNTQGQRACVYACSERPSERANELCSCFFCRPFLRPTHIPRFCVFLPLSISLRRSSLPENSTVQWTFEYPPKQQQMEIERETRARWEQGRREQQEQERAQVKSRDRHTHTYTHTHAQIQTHARAHTIKRT